MKLKDVKFVRAKEADYDNGRLETCPVANYYDQWLPFLRRYWGCGVSRKDFDTGCHMTGDNRQRFRKAFGRCAFVFHGSHTFHCWLMDLGTAHLLVLTAKDKGTCYEAVKMLDGKKIPVDIPRALEAMEMIGDMP